MFFQVKLPHGLPPKRNIDHRIDLLLGVAPISILSYQLSRFEEDDVSKSQQTIPHDSLPTLPIYIIFQDALGLTHGHYILIDP